MGKERVQGDPRGPGGPPYNLQTRRRLTPSMQATFDMTERISRISESSTMKVAADADRLRREGIDVVDFGAGETDFPTPENIKQAAGAAIGANFTKDTATRGILELKQALVDWPRS